MEEDIILLTALPIRRKIKEIIESIKYRTALGIDKINVELIVTAPTKIYEVM